MRKKKLLIILLFSILFLCFVTLVCCGAVFYLLERDDNRRNSLIDPLELPIATDDDVDEPETIEGVLYTMTNCKLYEITPEEVAEIEFVNNTNVDCFDKKVFHGEYAMVRPHYTSLIMEGVDEDSLYLLDVKKKIVTEVEYDFQSAHAAVFNPLNKKLYSYLEGEGVYEGTLDDPLEELIFESDTVIYGRGGMFTDDFGLRLSPGFDKLMIVDTFTSEEKDGSYYNSLKVIDLGGEILYETTGSFGKWIDEDRIAFIEFYPDTDYENELVVANVLTDNRLYLDVGPYAFHIDIAGGHILIDYFVDDEYFEVEDLRTSIFAVEEYNKEYDLKGARAYHYVLDDDQIVGKEVFDCVGNWDEGGYEYPCPMDGVFGFYEERIVLEDIETNEREDILTFDMPELPMWIE